MASMIMFYRNGAGAGGSLKIGIRIDNTRFISTFLIFFVILQLHTTTAQAQVGYGPRFDPCGDNCQTALLHFCTQLRDAKQQSDCWCGVEDLDRQYTEKMDACLATCDPAVSRRDVQRDMILRYRQVVCKGSAEHDEEFQAYYEERYGIAFTPKATAAAPPPPPAITIKPSSSDSGIRKPTSFIEDPSSSRTSSVEEVISTSLAPPTATTSSSQVTETTVTSPTSTDVTSYSSSDSRPALNVGEITGISLASVAAVAGAIGIFILLYRRHKRRERRKRRFSKSPTSHDEYMWSPISPATGKSHDSLLRTKRGVKRSIYDFLGWKPEPSGLDIGSHYTSEPSYKHNPFSQDDDQVPTIRVVSPSGSNRRLQVSPPMMMSGASGGGVPAGSPPPRGPLPPRPRQPRQQFYPPRFNIPSMATTGSVGTESTIPDRSDVILPPFPAPPTTIPRHHYQPEPPHAVTTPSGYAPPDFGIFVHPYAHGHDPTRLSAISQITDMDFGRMSRSSLAESACSQQTDIEDDDDDCCESVWTDYNNDCRTDGTGTLERRARLDDLFLAVESEYRTSYAERYDEAGRPPLPPLPTNTVVRTRSGRNIATARSDESNGRRLC